MVNSPSEASSPKNQIRTVGPLAATEKGLMISARCGYRCALLSQSNQWNIAGSPRSSSLPATV
jgi:hypothetical protein